MKSTIREHQKNNLKNVGKTSMIFLGLVALTFTTANAATEFETQVLDQQESATYNVVNAQNESQLVFVSEGFSNNIIENSEADVAIFNPNSVIKTTYVKTIEEVITENKLITEGQEDITQQLSIATTIEDSIAEDNQIIESHVSNEVYPLDFNKINHAIKAVKCYNNAAITVDLKL